jgi:ABC-type multidrug transport system fused ATPase/permease subunit
MKEEKSVNPLKYLFSMVWKYSEGNRRNFVAFVTLMIVGITIDLVASPQIMGMVMDTIQIEGVTKSNISSLILLLSMVIIVDLVFWAFHGPGRVLEQYNAFLVRVNYRKRLLGGILSMPLMWHSEHHSGDTIDKVNRGADALHSFSDDSFQVIYAIMRMIVSYGALVYFCPWASVIVIIMIIITMWIVISFDTTLMVGYKKINSSENRITQSILDSITNIGTIVTLRVGGLVFDRLHKELYEPNEVYRSTCKKSEVKWFLVNMSCSLMFALVLSLYLAQELNTATGVMIGNVFILVRYLDNMSRVFFDFAGMYSSMVKNSSRVINSESLASQFVAVTKNDATLGNDWTTIGVENLQFSYHDADRNRDLHLDDISFEIRRGEKIAFVGESGSGKTTTLKILRGLYLPNKVVVKVDDVILPDGFDRMANVTSLVPQNPDIFATTIAENITFGKEGGDLALINSTDTACFTSVARALPKGFNSSIKEKGVNLSGGEAQRMALARGLYACSDYKSSQILILDEPAKSLDTRIGTMVYENIFREFAHMTIISSLHTLSLLPMFDRVIVFKDGKIIGAGTVDELKKSCPEFCDLVARGQTGS